MWSAWYAWSSTRARVGLMVLAHLVLVPKSLAVYRDTLLLPDEAPPFHAASFRGLDEVIHPCFHHSVIHRVPVEIGLRGKEVLGPGSEPFDLLPGVGKLGSQR